MPLPDNTIPMMAGWGQFGALEMGGMFTVMKVREGLAADDYSDPGDYEHPPGTVAYEWTGQLPTAARAPGPTEHHEPIQSSSGRAPHTATGEGHSGH